MNACVIRRADRRNSIPFDRLIVAVATLALSLTTLASPAAASVTSMSVVSADVKIQSMNVTSIAGGRSLVSLTQVVIQNDNDDDAQNVQLIVTLPPTSRVVFAPAATVLGPSFADPNTPWRTIGHVTVPLGTLGVGKSISVFLATEMMVEFAVPTTSIAAFVFSDLPDPNGASNVRSAPVISAS